MNDLIERAIADLVDALYASEYGIDQRSHEAVITLLRTSANTLEEADRRTKDLNARVDATDGSFYFAE